MKFNEFTNSAVAAAEKAGEILLKHHSKNIKVEFKGRIDPVTIADRQSQEAIISSIKRKFPGHTFMGEEDKKKAVCSEFCWIIDPLDGTVNFIHGLPQFCVSIGLSHLGKIIAGVVYAPLMGEMYIAQKGAGSWLNGKRIRVSGINKLVRSLVVTGFPYDIHANSKSIIRSLSNVLVEIQGLRRLGSAALDLAYVAAGRFEAFWELGLHPWDVAAGSLLVTEAGGKVTDFNGKKEFLWDSELLASNGKIHQVMLKLIK